MRVCTIALVWAATLGAADEQRLALAMKAQAEWEHVERAAAPQLRDTVACVQSQAGLLPLGTREDMPIIHYHKGYCTLVGATITHNAAEFAEAAAEFDKVIATWPAHDPNGGKNSPPEPVSVGVRVLAQVARLETGPDEETIERARKEIASAIDPPACSWYMMPPKFCEGIVEAGRQWLGWMALRRGNLVEAAREFSTLPDSGWPAWVAGRKAFADHKYGDAAMQYHRAVEVWARAGQEPARSLTARLSPGPDMAAALADLGGAQLLAGDTTSAMATLDGAIKTNPGDARAFYLRARAKELVGQTEAALADYNLASRTAFASAKDLASGEAHLYRGIQFYRRKDYARAEDEFASALNFEIQAPLRADAEAWRHLAAVARGSCRASREYLERSLSAVSPYFPVGEARTLLAACTAAQTAGGIGGDFPK